MRVSGEEYLRVSQLRPVRSVLGGGVSGAATLINSIGTAPAYGSASSTGVDHSDLEMARRVAERVEADGSDVREDVIASLRARIESGSYQVTGEQIAEMMVRRLLADRVR